MGKVESIFSTMSQRRMLNEEKQNTVETAVETPAEEVPAVETPAESGAEGSVETPAEEVPAEEVPVVETPAVETPAESGAEGSVDEENLDEATKKVIRDGEVVTKKVSTVKKRLSSAQKAALKKARKKAHTAAAERARKKSNKVRSNKGMNEEDLIECEDCGFTGEVDDFNCEDGIYTCPECGAVVKVEEDCDESEVDVAELTVRLNECGASPYMIKALNEGKYDMVRNYLEIKEG